MYLFSYAGKFYFSSLSSGYKASWEGSEVKPRLLSINPDRRRKVVKVTEKWFEWSTMRSCLEGGHQGEVGLTFCMNQHVSDCLEIVFLGADTSGLVNSVFPLSCHGSCQAADAVMTFKCLTRARTMLISLVFSLKKE